MANVSDIKALRQWNTLPHDMRELLIDNVFCVDCGVTTIVDYTVTKSRQDVLLEGKCKKCGHAVARVVEFE